MEDRLPRRLAAVLYADVAGYSRLTGENEDATHRALGECLDLISRTVALYRGHVVHYAGDALLAKFDAVVDAVSSAIAIQRELNGRNVDLPPERRLEFRIGVNLGDVIEDRGDIYGDGVNVAARLENLAQPGGVCVSDATRRALDTSLPLRFEPLGEQALKNVDEPIRAYQVSLEQGGQVPAPAITSRTRRPVRRYIRSALAVVLLIGGVLLTWLWSRSADVEPASLEKMTFSLPDKPSLAVLPFDNLSSDPEQDYFADGMTDDLITDLSKLSGVFVISRNSTFIYKGEAVRVQRVAEELGVRYVLEGSVRRSGDKVRINAQLIDALSGNHLWAERYDRLMTDIFSVQDEVVGQIVVAMAVELSPEQSPRVSTAETDVPGAYDALLQAREHYRRQTPEDHAKAITFLEMAIQLDPDYYRAYGALARVYWSIHDLGWGLESGLGSGESGIRARAYLAKALEQPTSDAYAVAADILVFEGDHQKALAEIDRAIALEPNTADHYASQAWILIVSGRAEEAERSIRQAMRLDPKYRVSYLRTLGHAQFHQGHYEDAAKTLERAVSRQPDYAYAYDKLVAAYGYLDRWDEAKSMAERYDAIQLATGNAPISVHGRRNWYKNAYDFDERYLDQYLEGLRKAGVPEGEGPQPGDNDYEALITKVSGAYEVRGATKIDAPTAKVLHDRGAVFVDVRSSEKYNRQGHIPSAANLYLDTDLSEERLSALVGKDDEVVFYCAGEDCYLSPHACAKAISWGFTRVYYFASGLPGWTSAGYPVATIE